MYNPHCLVNLGPLSHFTPLHKPRKQGTARHRAANFLASTILLLLFFLVRLFFYRSYFCPLYCSFKGLFSHLLYYPVVDVACSSHILSCCWSSLLDFCTARILVLISSALLTFFKVSYACLLDWSVNDLFARLLYYPVGLIYSSSVLSLLFALLLYCSIIGLFFLVSCTALLFVLLARLLCCPAVCLVFSTTVLPCFFSRLLYCPVVGLSFVSLTELFFCLVCACSVLTCCWLFSDSCTFLLVLYACLFYCPVIGHLCSSPLLSCCWTCMLVFCCSCLLASCTFLMLDLFARLLVCPMVDLVCSTSAPVLLLVSVSYIYCSVIGFLCWPTVGLICSSPELSCCSCCWSRNLLFCTVLIWLVSHAAYMLIFSTHCNGVVVTTATWDLCCPKNKAEFREYRGGGVIY